MMKALLVLVGFAAGAFVTYTFTQVQEARAAANRVYELRTYHTLPGTPARARKALPRPHHKDLREAWHEECRLLGSAGCSTSENTLIYVISHESREAAKANWSAFGKDPDWKAAQKASEADGKIIEKLESVYMNPTDYSPVK